MENECPLCHHRVSNWMMATGKTTIVQDKIYHKSCLIDNELRYGKEGHVTISTPTPGR